MSPEPSLTLAMVRPPPPIPKFTVNWAGLPRAVERTAVTWYVQGEALEGSESSVMRPTRAHKPDGYLLALLKPSEPACTPAGCGGANGSSFPGVSLEDSLNPRLWTASPPG